MQPLLLTVPTTTASATTFATTSVQDGEGAGTAASDGGTTPPPPAGGLGSLLVPAVLIFGIFYFVLIRPERKKQQERQAMLSTLKKGTKVMTTSGLYGSVTQMQEDVVTLQVADGVRLRFNRAAIQEVLDDAGSGKGKGAAEPAATETPADEASETKA